MSLDFSITDSVSSNQPTIRIVEDKSAGFAYLVYVGQESESDAEEHLVWARLQAAGHGWAMGFGLGPSRLRLRSEDFFQGQYKFAVCLRLLLKSCEGKAWLSGTIACSRKWEDRRDFLRIILRVVLEECAGDVLTIGESPRRSLREMNASTAFSRFSSRLPLLYIGGGRGNRPHYYSPFYFTSTSPALEAVVIRDKGGIKDATQPTELLRDAKQPAVRKCGNLIIVEAKGRGSEEKECLPESTSDKESNETAAKGSKAETMSEKIQGLHLRFSAPWKPISKQKQTNNSDNPPNQGAEKDAPSDEPNKALNCTGDHAVNAPWADEIKRLLIQPVKEKALSAIETHLQAWREGSIDEVAFEDRIRASLLDVRLTRQMQDTLVQSKQSAQVNPGQDPILESARKRRADSHGDIDRPSKAVRGNEESGSK